MMILDALMNNFISILADDNKRNELATFYQQQSIELHQQYQLGLDNMEIKKAAIADDHQLAEIDHRLETFNYATSSNKKEQPGVISKVNQKNQKMEEEFPSVYSTQVKAKAKAKAKQQGGKLNDKQLEEEGGGETQPEEEEDEFYVTFHQIKELYQKILLLTSTAVQNELKCFLFILICISYKIQTTYGDINGIHFQKISYL